MKHWMSFILLAVAGFLTLPSLAVAQTYDHGEVGVFADYYRLDRISPNINFIGLGGRVAFNVHPNIALEAEMAYDFKRNFTSTFSDGVSTELVDTRLRPLHALFGPKFQLGRSSPVRLFVTGKVGFINFTTSNQNAGPGFVSALGAVTTGNTRVAFYPGAGIEGFWGPFGLRLDVGDEIYFDNGARNNVRVSFGPHFRF